MSEATISKSMHSVIPMSLDAAGACLIHIYPADALGGVWSLEESCVIGRVADCDLQVMDEAASRHHCAIRRVGPDYVIADLGSTNGTFVNDEAVSERVLQPEDRICVGQQIFKFLAADHVEVQYHNTLYRMVTTDALTQAHNRQYMEELLERELLRASRRGRPLGLLMMDIDHFKRVNDEHGHLAGDEVLREFSRRVRSVLEDEVICRFGGEEFAVVAGECCLDEVAQLGESIREAIAAQPFATCNGDLRVTVSIGAVEARLRGLNSVHDLLSDADHYLYKAKASGRNQVCRPKG